MDTVRLRTLALKSVLGFGKYHDMTVHQVLSLKHTRYLRWCYYHCSMISFNDEILDYINVMPEDKIEKPGKDPLKYEKVNERIEAQMSGLGKYIMKKTNNSIMNKRARFRLYNDLKQNSPIKMMYKNHGTKF